MTPEKERARLFTRRAALLLGGKLLLFGGLAARLSYLQTVEGGRYRLMADGNRINLRVLPPLRGMILDRDGRRMAVNVQTYRITLTPEQANADVGVETVLQRLAMLVTVPDHDLRRVLRDLRRSRGFTPVTVRETLSWDDVSRVSVNAPDLPGIDVDVGQTRFYPSKDAVAHVLGYVGSVTEQELTGDPLLATPGFLVGRQGIERRYDLPLRGRGGVSKVEVNALGRVMRELERTEGQPGRDLRLTLDSRLQEYVHVQLLDRKAASVALLDVHSGDVLALASAPAFDPNAFSAGLKERQWEILLNNPYKPLLNKAISGQYAPGSTFKIPVALAALAQGISPDQNVFCPGYLELGDRRFHCWKKEGHGRVDLNKALRESCDVWFYEISRRIGVTRIAEMAQRLGLGAATGIDLPGEASGLIPDPAWKLTTQGQSWLAGETLLVGIGQGYVLATPLQLAVMTARVVNGGLGVTPRLTAQRFDDGFPLDDAAPPLAPALGIPPAHLKVVMAALDEVVNHPRGTAAQAALLSSGLEMGGKTGTSQIRRISQVEREGGVISNDALPWRLRDHALFVAFAPVSAPLWAVAVVVEHGGSGSSGAAPVARDVLLQAQRLLLGSTS